MRLSGEHLISYMPNTSSLGAKSHREVVLATESESFATQHDDIAALMHTELFADSGFYS